MKPMMVKGNVGFNRIPAAFKGSAQAQGTLDSRASMRSAVHRLEQLIDHLRGALPDVVENTMGDIFYLSQLYCPVKTGYLKDSGRLEVHEAGKHVIGTISYGGNGDIPYAAIVHERTDLHHESPTRSKYLQAAFEEIGDELAVNVAVQLKRSAGL